VSTILINDKTKFEFCVAEFDANGKEEVQKPISR